MKKCRGIIIPQYKPSKQMRKNPLFPLVEDANEFEVIHVNIEVNSICIDCKRVQCKDESMNN